MKTVFRNLLNNAIKFSYRNSKINVDCRHGANKTTITFADSGTGITPENIEKLWGRFAPFSTNGSEDEQGTGLGLVSCKEFVEKHDGNLHVESEFGEGSRFIIEFGSKVTNGFYPGIILQMSERSLNYKVLQNRTTVQSVFGNPF